jgi:hypothetical protein
VKEYSFNRVLGPESRQEEVYALTTQPLVDALYMGKSGASVFRVFGHHHLPPPQTNHQPTNPNKTNNPGLLFAYGVTNAGKTYTILGTEAAPGVLPRALSDIFARLERDAVLGSAVLAARYVDVCMCLVVVCVGAVGPFEPKTHAPPIRCSHNQLCGPKTAAAPSCAPTWRCTTTRSSTCSRRSPRGARADRCVWAACHFYYLCVGMYTKGSYIYMLCTNTHTGAQAGGPRGPHRGEGPLQAQNHGGAAR